MIDPESPPFPIMTDIKVGQKVQIKRTQTTCLVVEVCPHNPQNPIEEHGFITLKVLKPGRSHYEVGYEEHWSHYMWENGLVVLS